MGMDVYGNTPTSKSGEYFRNSVWAWHPLAAYIEEVAPTIAAHCEHWHTNDGDGLNKALSKNLAAALRRELESGRTVEYVEKRSKALEELPDKVCCLCNGTGIRTDEIGQKYRMPERKVVEAETPNGIKNPRLGRIGWCNGCLGHGKKRPFETYYQLDVQNIREFVEFLEHCGGFRIC